MKTLIDWALRNLDQWGLREALSLFGPAVANWLEPFARALIALIGGILSIIADLSKTFEGRITLGIVALGLLSAYAFENFTIVRLGQENCHHMAARR